MHLDICEKSFTHRKTGEDGGEKSAVQEKAKKKACPTIVAEKVL